MSRMIDANTVLLGLLASPCRHSISPAMHNAAFDKLGINYAYLSFDVDTDTIKGAVDAIRVLKMRGANVSMPNKRAVGIGFVQSLIDEGIEVKGKKLVLAGAGGAGTAIATQAALDGFYEIAFFNRKNARFENAEKLAEKINQETDCKVTMHDLNDKEDFRKSLETADVYCDATSVGMVPLEEKSDRQARD